MPIDNKYGEVSFAEENTIGADEPVMVFRAADPLTPWLLTRYYQKCVDEGCPERHTELIKANHDKIVKWQQENPDKVRTLPTSSNWNGEQRLP